MPAFCRGARFCQLAYTRSEGDYLARARMPPNHHEIGQHRIEIRGDLIVSRWSGVCSLAELEAFLVILNAMLVRERHPFVIVDNTHAAPGVPEVRRRLFEWSRTHRIGGGLVVFGSSSAARVMVMLILRAIALWKGGDLQKRIVVLPDEAAAHAWIARRREELAAESNAPTA